MRKLAAVVALTLLAACPSHAPIRPDAFDRGQRVAILALRAQPKIANWSVEGAVAAEVDAAPVLAEVRPIVVEAMGKNPHFKLVPEAKVFAAPAYVAHADGPDLTGCVSAPGYKPVTDEALYPQIAREAGAEIGMGVLLTLTFRAEDGAAAVILAVGAIDTRGRGVWKGAAAVVSEKATDVRTAPPRARIEAYKDATRKAMAQLEETMTEQLAMESARGRQRY